MNPSQPPVAWLSATWASSVADPAAETLENNDEQHWIRADQLAVSVHDLGFRQSVVAVERLRTYGQRPAYLSLHIVRWRRTLEHLAIALPVDEQAIAARIDELIERNAAWCQQQGEFGITMLATPGCDPLADTAATEILHLNPLPHAKIQRHRDVGQPLIITDIHQPSDRSWPRDIKVRCRLHYYLADREAQEVDPDAVGVLLDADGSVTETSIANLAICRAGEIVSPTPAQVLPGVTQQVIQQFAKKIGFNWSHATLFPADLREADEVWLMGTDGGLWFASRVDGVLIGGGKPGSIYQQVLSAFDAATRQGLF